MTHRPTTGRQLICSDQRGFTLLEGLIAMSILAFGLLGLAGMHTIAMMYNVDANELTLATNHSAAMMERIHYNRRNVTAYNTINTGLVAPNICPNAPAGAPPTQPTARGDCLQWQADLNNSQLDNAVGRVAIANPFGPAGLNQSQVTVIVTWSTETGGGGGVGGAGMTTGRKVTRTAKVTMQSVVTPP